MSAFKERYIGQKYRQVTNNHLNRRRRSTLARESALLEKVREFDDLQEEEKSRVSVIVKYCKKFSYAGYGDDIESSILQSHPDEEEIEEEVQDENPPNFGSFVDLLNSEL